jgi:hypothetical protein
MATEQDQRNQYWDRINALSVKIQALAAMSFSHMKGDQDIIHDILYYDYDVREQVRTLYVGVYNEDPDDDAMSDMIGDLVDAIIARRSK